MCYDSFWVFILITNTYFYRAYLALISQPMDLTTLITELNAGNLEGPQHFLDLALTIFQNSIDYNAGHQG